MRFVAPYGNWFVYGGMLMVGLLMSVLAGCGSGSHSETTLSSEQMLGRFLFFDTRLSSSSTMSCATCHSPSAGFADPRTDSPVSHGALSQRVGSRNAPSVAYAAYSPTPRTFDATPQTGNMKMGWYVGGQFWDGRAGDLAEQAKAPLLNPVEMNNADAAQVVQKVKTAPYAALFVSVYGSNAFADVNTAFDHITRAIAQYERSSEVCKFTSKYDQYVAGQVQLTEQEARGLALFTGNANCVKCHSMDTSLTGKALFTSFGSQNIGVPANPQNPWYQMPAEFNPAGAAYVDKGIGETMDDPMQQGKFKIPSLRNVAMTAPYMHNGVFTTLKQVVHFDNTRDIASENWPAPEVAANVHRHMPPMMGFFGQLGLTDEEEDAIVAFLMTLTDR